ncbi:MAG TPA: hypothetical protein VGB45_14310 [Abditibacterium sp.]
MPEKPSQLAENPAPPQNIEKTAFDQQHRSEARAELRVARRAGMRWRGIARWLGLGIFVFGASLLFYVFYQALTALQRYANPGRLNSDFNSVAGDTMPSVIQAVFAVFGTELLRVLYLLILGFIASAIAARGIQFFAASEAVIDEAVLPEE